MSAKFLPPLFLSAAFVTSLRAVDLPLTVDFTDAQGYKTGPLNGQQGWRAEQGSVYIVDSQGVRWLSIPAAVTNGQASVYFKKPDINRPVFFDLSLWLGAGEEAVEFADVNGSLASLVWVGTDGRLFARHRDGAGADQWVDTSVRLALDASGAARDWTRLTIRQDSATGTWDLYVNGVMKAANFGLLPDERETEGYFTLMGDRTHELRLSHLAIADKNMLFADANSDGLPDAWQEKLTRPGRDDDPDGDGLSNLEEYIAGTSPLDADTDHDGLTDAEELRAGTNPLKADGVAASAVSAEFWLTDSLAQAKLPPSLFECRRDGVFERASSKSTPLVRLDFQDLFDAHYAARVRGRITAPVSGDYTFWVSGSDSVEFWLSGDDAPFQKKFLARSSTATNYHEFDVLASQKSRLVRLEAGHSYYFEVLHHVTTDGAGQFSVAWQVPGRKREVISGKSLAPWSGDARDPGDRGLPDAWLNTSKLAAAAGKVVGGLNPLLGKITDVSKITDGILREDQRQTFRKALDLGQSMAELDPDGDKLTNRQEYQLGSDPLKADAAGRQGFLTREVWFGLPGRYLFDSTGGAGVFPRSPWWTEYPDTFEGPRDIGQDYLSRIRGFVVIPQTGKYRFHLAADDQAALWLGTGADKFTKQKIAFVPVATEWHEWDRFASQTSAEKILTKGQVLYIEVLHKQGLSDSHIAVAWTRPGSLEPEVIDGQNLMSWKPQSDDADDDDLPDAWQTQYGLKEGQGGKTFSQIHAWGDADGDGVSNEAERLAGTSPVDAASCPAAGLQWRIWDGVAGSSLAGLDTIAGFPAKPTRRKALLNTDFSAQSRNCLSQLRGYVVAPVSGNYVFSIAGSDQSQLWLSTDEKVFNKKLIARVAASTPWRHREWNTQQSSAPVRLEAGKKYYLEILHKQGSGPDYFTAGWNVPGMGQSIITEEYLRPYVPSAEDLDDDGLPDTWELTHGLNPADPSGANGAWGDPDADLLTNFAEYSRGTNPQRADSANLSGLVLWELWDSIPGPALTRLTGNARFPARPDQRVLLEQAEVPADRGSWYGGRLRGYLVPPVSGVYEMLVSGDDQAALYVSTGESKFDRRLVAGVPFAVGERNFSVFPEQKGKVALEAGKRYFFELLHKEDTDRNHASVAWVIPGSTVPVIPAGEAIAAFGFDPADLDDDELPDAWETTYSLDPRDNGNVEPVNGPWGDPDHDGLANIDEWRSGTSPVSGDTDGDGLSDDFEKYVTGTNPAVRDELRLEPVTQVPGASAVAVRGQGESTAEGFTSLTSAGAASLAFTLKTDGVAFLRLSAQVLPSATKTPLALAVKVDGVALGDLPLSQPEVPPGMVSGRLPWLLKGSHTLEISWALPEAGKSLRLESLEVFQTPAGTSSPVADANAAASAITSTAAESLTSPFCLEGTAAFPKLVRLDAGAEVKALPDRGWYADVPLPADGSALTVKAAFENGLKTQTATISWKACNLLESGNLVLRAGDALRLTAAPSNGGAGAAGKVRITVNGEETAVTTPGAPVEHEFAKSGTYRVEASFAPADGGPPVTGGIEVKALGAPVPNPILLYSGHPRTVSLTGLPDEAEVFPDPLLYLVERAGAHPRFFDLAGSFKGDALIAFRLPDKGPVIGTTRVSGLTLLSDVDTNYYTERTLPDGTRIVVMDVFMPVVEPGMRLRVDIIVAGVTFEDGTVTKWLTAEDFDASGMAHIRFVAAPGLATSFCHHLTLYDGDSVLGTR